MTRAFPGEVRNNPIDLLPCDCSRNRSELIHLWNQRRNERCAVRLPEIIVVKQKALSRATEDSLPCLLNVSSRRGAFVCTIIGAFSVILT